MEKTFNLEAAKKGAVIKDQYGRQYKFVAHEPLAEESQRLILLRDDGDILVFYENGTSGGFKLHTEPLTITKYLRVYKNSYGEFYPGSSFYDTQGEAKEGHIDIHSIVPVTIEI